MWFADGCLVTFCGRSRGDVHIYISSHTTHIHSGGDALTETYMLAHI